MNARDEIWRTLDKFSGKEEEQIEAEEYIAITEEEQQSQKKNSNKSWNQKSTGIIP